LLYKYVEHVARTFEAQGASVELRFVVELREAGQIKTPKIPRDLKERIEQCFACLSAALCRKRVRTQSVTDWLRECSRGPDGADLSTLIPLVLWVAVNHIFAGKRE
jgi:hypothetical protein